MNLEELLAEREIYRALVGVARAMDRRDWAELDALTSEDIATDVGVGQQSSRADFVATMRSFLDDCGPTQHLLGNVLIEISGDTAKSQAYVSDMHVGAGNKAHLSFRTLGDYHDEWQNIEGTWRMTRRTKHNHAHLGSFEVLGSGPAQ